MQRYSIENRTKLGTFCHTYSNYFQKLKNTFIIFLIVFLKYEKSWNFFFLDDIHFFWLLHDSDNMSYRFPGKSTDRHARLAFSWIFRKSNSCRRMVVVNFWLEFFPNWFGKFHFQLCNLQQMWYIWLFRYSIYSKSSLPELRPIHLVRSRLYKIHFAFYIQSDTRLVI